MQVINLKQRDKFREFDVNAQCSHVKEGNIAPRRLNNFPKNDNGGYGYEKNKIKVAFQKGLAYLKYFF